MIKIVFYRQGDAFWGFEESGHAGYAESGDDIICSAVSAMSMLVINTVEVSYAANIDYRVDESTTDVTVCCKSALPQYETDEAKRFAVSGLFYGYYLQLMELLEDYYEYLDVSLVEKHCDDSDM